MEPSGPVQACNGIALPFTVDVHGIDVANTDDNNQECIPVGGSVRKWNILQSLQTEEIVSEGFLQVSDGWIGFTSTIACKTLSSVVQLQVQIILQLIYSMQNC
jgi:hypothetical protein